MVTKKRLFSVVGFCFFLVTSTACGLKNQSNDDSGKIKITELFDYSLDIADATCLGIERTSNNVQARRAAAPALSSNNSNTITLVKTSEQCIPNDPTVNDDGTINVTFKKIVKTTNETTNTYTKEVFSDSKGTIVFSYDDGFTYDLLNNDEIVYSDIRDNSENDGNPVNGVVRLLGLNPHTNYTLKYYGTQEEVVIEQSDIQGQIDKFFVDYNFTFIQFGARNVRDDNLCFEYDIDGVSLYDKRGYKNTNLRQFFVVDNETGFIYHPGNFLVEAIQNHMIVSYGKIYDMDVNENNELVFVPIVTNTNFQVSSFFKDRYGYKYICNDTVDSYDSSTKTFFYTDPQRYFFGEGDEVVKYDSESKQLTKIINGEESPVTGDENFDMTMVFKGPVWQRYDLDGFGEGDAPMSYGYFSAITSYLLFKQIGENTYLVSQELYQKTGGGSRSPSHYYGDEDILSLACSFDNPSVQSSIQAWVLSLTDDGYQKKEYTETVVAIDNDYYLTYDYQERTVYSNNFLNDTKEAVLSNVPGPTHSAQDFYYARTRVKFVKETFNQTNTYEIIFNKESNSYELVSIENISYDDLVIVFQPINK